MVKEILNIKTVREKSENFLILSQNCLIVAENLVIFFSLALLAQHFYKLMFILENVCPKTLKHFIFELNN